MLLRLIYLLFCSSVCYGQSQISVQAGWTAAQVRAYERSSNGMQNLVDLADFPILHSAYIGAEYEYDYRKLHVSTGLSFMTFGSKADPFFGHPWPIFYWVVPVLGGYKTTVAKDLDLLAEAGVDLGLQQGQDFVNVDYYRFNVNVVVGAELHWKRFCLGTRFHWALTNFRVFEPFSYKHTAITTYIGYTLWDHKKCKTRRLAKKQAQLLD